MLLEWKTWGRLLDLGEQLVRDRFGVCKSLSLAWLGLEWRSWAARPGRFRDIRVQLDLSSQPA